MRNRYSSKKKLGVLVSSLALVAVTAMAGVTGTAAWFTANRTNSATASTFTAKAPNGNLTITAQGIANKGTTVGEGQDETTKKTVLVKDNTNTGTLVNYLRDASFDATTGTLYRANIDDSYSSATNSSTNATVKSYSVVTDYDTGSSVSVGSETHKLYYAVSWTFTFSYSNPNTHGSALFFDPANSNFGINSAQISKGFRIAMNNYTASGATVNASDYLVWANGTVKTHVSGSTSEDTATYDDANFVSAGQTSYDRSYDGIEKTTAEGKRDYIGTFKASSDAITVTCTAWYEGTDQGNVNNTAVATAEALTATMAFYVVDLGVAT